MINSWICSFCNSYNDCLTLNCKNCKANNPLPASVRTETFFKRGLCDLKIMANESDKIELHTKFFNAEKVLYSAMTFEQRIAHRAELASLIFEARARMNAVDDVDREEKGRLSPDGKQWLVSNNESINVSDAINAPKERKQRMSKGDKLKESMSALGLDMTMINSIMGSVAAAQSGGSVVTDSSRELKPGPVYTFVKEKPNNNTQESLLADVSSGIIQGIETRPVDDLYEAAKTAGHIGNKLLGPFKEEEILSEIKPKIIVETEESKEPKPFNPASLFGKK